jgi:hypothetical protein
LKATTKLVSSSEERSKMLQLLSSFQAVSAWTESVFAEYAKGDRVCWRGENALNVHLILAKVVLPSFVAVADQCEWGICSANQVVLIWLLILDLCVRRCTSALFDIVLELVVSTILGFQLANAIPAQVIFHALTNGKLNRNKLYQGFWSVCSQTKES